MEVLRFHLEKYVVKAIILEEHNHVMDLLIILAHAMLKWQRFATCGMPRARREKK
jgi:hypothetical protein